MSMLSDRDIMANVQCGDIKIEPFDPSSMGTNSYDVHLGPVIKTYARVYEERWSSKMAPLDVSAPRGTVSIELDSGGVVLEPGELYLGSTVEYTESHKHVPMLNGKSSLGRLGLMIHITAGFGDVGFCNHWTLELAVIRPLRIYPGMAIGQLCWFETITPPLVKYNEKHGAKYVARSADPQASESWRAFSKPKRR